jgi:hypothetical protein
MNPILRSFLIWGIGFIFIIYLAGTVRIAWPLLTHGGSAKAPTSSILTILYVRVLIMALLVYLFRLLRRNRQPRQ